MPRYGMNFNGQSIPATAAKFAWRVKVQPDGTLRAVGNNRSCDLILQGVCNTPREAELMREQADNGHRQIRIEGPRRRFANGPDWYAVYCG